MLGSLKITRRRGGQVLSFVTGLLASVGASANPQGAQVVSGSAVFANPTPQTLQITNSPAAVLNWQSFDIGKGETTRFIQQNAASTVLNRVTTGNSSDILGKLISNGHVFLINPAGILIGRDGSVDTAGVVLSTLQITDQDFLAGRFKFQGDAASGAITNHGYIKTAAGGEVVLIAPRIENIPEAGNAKSGLIESPNGDLVLAAGSSITIASLDDPDITFDVRAPDNEVVNLGRLLARGGTASILAGTIRHSGEINADSFSRDTEGRISLKASNRIALADGSLVRASGGSTADGGSIAIDARNAQGNATIDALGAVRADGVSGGKVVVRANNLLLDGIVSARGSEAGGTIDIKTTDAIIATTHATLQTDSTEGQGGRIHIDGGKSAFTSGSIRASGERGGSVRVLGDEVTLAAARIRADGELGGGRVRIGGGFRGGENLRAAEKVTINDTSVIHASARSNGRGGDVVAWSDGTTRFAGSITVRGGADGGDGGRVEVSGRAGLGFTGDVNVTAPNGKIGTLLLDPKNIRFTSAELPAAPSKLLDPHPGADNFFGGSVDYFDASGNRVFTKSSATTVVVYDSHDDFGGADAGAVYVYRLFDGALLSGLHGLTGKAAGDRVGNEFLDTFALNGQHLLRTREWGGGAGALTIFNPVTGTSGTVDASTSLVGAAVGDNIGSSSIQFLGGTSAAVLSPSFNSGSGAITIVTAGNLRGTVSSGRSLVGANSGDQLGASLTDLGNGHWAARSANGGLGSITILHAGTPATGVVGAGNSLVGSTAGDAIGTGLFRLGNSAIWVATSNQWNGGIGAVTWINRAATPTGPIDASNSLLGNLVGDLGNGGAQFNRLSGDNYLLFSENGSAGAVTFVTPSSLPVGLVSSSNSLVGLSTDRIGHSRNGSSSNFSFLGNKFLIYSPTWNNNAGAVTVGDITSGFAPNVVDATNSLVGASADDLVGDSHVTETSFGVGLLRSVNGGAGAITFIDSSAAPRGTVGATNSLLGGSSNDQIGSGGITLVGGTTYAILSPSWTTPGGKIDAGAVTLVDGATGTFNGTGTALDNQQVGITNSLVGSEAGDRVGSGGVRFAYSTTSDSVFSVLSPRWDNTLSVPDAGAITWFTLGSALRGDVPSAGSLFGSSPGDLIGNGNTFVSGLGFSNTGVYQLFGSSTSGALFYSRTFNNNFGAVVYLDGSGPPTGPINSENALVGSTANDDVGGNGIFEFGNGKYAVMSPDWDNVSSDVSSADAGAVTIASSDTGVAGIISSLNSLIGDRTDDRVGSEQPDQLDSGNVIIRSPNWHDNTGAVTFVDLANGRLLGDTDFAGVVDITNSLTGVSTGDNVGADGSLREVAFNKYILMSSGVSQVEGPANVGAVTYFSDLTGIAGQINGSNSLVGSKAGDRVGNNGLTFLFNGNLLVRSSQWNSGAGAVTFLDVNSGHFGGSDAGDLTGVLDETNSLLGHSADDSVGSDGIEQSFTGNGYYMVFSPLVDNTTVDASNAGAVTFGDMQQGVRGFADSNTVSFVGTTGNDKVGFNHNTDATNNGNLYLRNPQWNGTFGAATFVDLVDGTGLSGDISALNSVVGSQFGDQVGSGGVQILSNGQVAILSPNWSNGGTTNAGAITFGSELTRIFGPISPTDNISLVGANRDDSVGSSDLVRVFGTNDLWYARTLTFDGGKSALTFFDAAGTAPTGPMGVDTSLIGSTVGDGIGATDSDDVFAVSNGATTRVVVMSPGWDNGAAVDAGAITTFLPNAPKKGAIDNINSLVGTQLDDAIGDGYRVGLSNGNQLIVHSNWNSNRGAITFWNLSSNLSGNVGAANSLVGVGSGDFVGASSPQEIFGTSRYMVRTTSFNSNAGALTFGTITSGVKGAISAANSLLGANSDDFLGSNISSFSFTDGRALMLSPNGGQGAATYIDVTKAPRGVISAENSLVGATAGDGAGQSQRNLFVNNLHAVLTPGWDNGAATDAGAISMLDLSSGNFAGTNTPFAGNISAGNSLVGTFTGDQIGANRSFTQITTYQVGEQLLGAVFSSNWNSGRGAITWFKPGERPVGRVTAKNSLVGAFADDAIGQDQDDSFNHGLLGLETGNFVLISPHYNSRGGAVTFLNIARGLPVGQVTSGNSFVGTPGEGIGVGRVDREGGDAGGVERLGGDRVLILSPLATVDGRLHAGRIDLLDGSKTQAVDTIGFGSNRADELAVSIPAVVNFLNSGGALTLQASNDIFIPEGINLTAKGGSLTLEAGRSIEVKGNIFTAGFLRLIANAAGGDASQREAGEGFVSILADRKSSSVIAGQLEVDAQNVVLQGGNAKGAYALLYGLDSAKILAHGSGLVSLKAGTGEDVPPAPSFELLASLLPGQVADGHPIVIDAPIALLLAGKSLDLNSAEFIEMFGGGSGGAFAAIASFGELKVQTLDIKMEVGSVANTDAVFLGMGGAADISFTTCTGCGDLLADPLLDGGSQTGTFLAGLFVDPTINAVLANILQSENRDDEPATEEEEEEAKEASSAECH